MQVAQDSVWKGTKQGTAGVSCRRDYDLDWLELISLTGNVVTDDKGEYYHHTHAMFSFKSGEKHCTAAGHNVQKLAANYFYAYIFIAILFLWV
jgi:predicted DNA-binding protein with PD1-like motif